MKKFLDSFVKSFGFFICWAVLVGFVSIPSDNPVLWRFYAELIPLLSVILMSVVFYFIERKNITIVPVQRPFKSIILGILAGSLWLSVVVLTLYATNTISFLSKNSISYLSIWAISCFLNVIMQELLVRGYIYQLLKRNYSIFVSTIVTTALFLFCHGGAIEAGIIPILNIVTMSIFMTLVLEYTQSIISPIIIHFVWNFVGGIILGGVSLADDYPSIFRLAYHGNELLTGGVCKIEGSIVVLIVNITFIILFYYLLKKSILKNKY